MATTLKQGSNFYSPQTGQLQGTVQFDPNSGQRLSTGQSVTFPPQSTSLVPGATIPVSNIAAQPLTIPQVPTDTSAQAGLAVAHAAAMNGGAPAGWDPQSYANFKAANPGLEPTPEDTAKMQQATGTESSNLFSNLMGLINTQATEGDFTAGLQDQYDTAGKQQAINDATKNYNNTKASYQTQIQEMQKNSQGKGGGRLAEDIQAFQQKADQHLANLALQKTSAEGDLTTAQTIIDSKVKAKFDPIDKQITQLENYYQLNPNLGKKDAAEVQDKIDQLKEKRDQNSDALKTTLINATTNGAPASVLAAIDAASSAPDATPASIIAAGGKYSADTAAQLDIKYKNAQINKIYNDMSGSGVTSPTTTQTYTIQSGDDPYNIAQANNTDMATLQALNPQITDWHNIQPGTKLNLPLPGGQLSSDPTVDNYAQGILNGSITSIAQVPKEYKDAVTAALSTPGANGYSPLASSRFAMASNRIVNNYIALPQYQLTANGLPYLQRIDAAIKTPGSVSDQDLLDSLTKLNTAGNAISDAQIKLITGYKSFSDMAGTIKNKFTTGGALSPKQRQDIQTIANAIYSNYKQGYQPVYDQATAQLKASGIPEAFWTIPDLNKTNTQTAGGSSDNDPLGLGI